MKKVIYTRMISSDKEFSEILRVLQHMISKDSNIEFKLSDSIVKIYFSSKIGLDIFNEWKEKLKADF